MTHSFPTLRSSDLWTKAGAPRPGKPSRHRRAIRKSGLRPAFSLALSHARGEGGGDTSKAVCLRAPAVHWRRFSGNRRSRVVGDVAPTYGAICSPSPACGRGKRAETGECSAFHRVGIVTRE